MRHRVAGRGLGRTSSHRKALIRNQVTDLLRHDRIVTTEAKAKTIRPAAEKVITLGKRGTLHARRQAEAILTDRRVLRRVFDDIAPRFQTRPGGYTRIVKLGPRQGDGARMALIELVDGPVAAAASVAPAAPEVVEETAPAAEDIAADDAADEVETTDAADEGDAAEDSSEAEAELDAAGAEVDETDADATDTEDADGDAENPAAAEAGTTDDATDESADDASDDETESEEEKA